MTSDCGSRPEFELGVAVMPKKLPTRAMAPVALGIHGKISTADGSQPPPLKEVTADFDRDGSIDAKGLPVCRRAQLETHGTNAARALCRASIVGTGMAHVAIESSERVPLPLILFNGGIRDGTTTVFVQSSVSGQSPLVATVKLSKAPAGSFGLKAVMTIPQIAEGRGSVLDFSLEIKRLFEYRGAKRSYTTANCSKSHLRARLGVTFGNGEKIIDTVTQPCTRTD